MANPKSYKRGKIRSAGEIYETRRAAFRSAKRDNGVPITKHPDEVVKPRTLKGDAENLDHRNRRLYIFHLIDSFLGMFIRKTIHIREDKRAFYGENNSSQLEHFNSGNAQDDKLKNHHYYKRRNR